MVVEFQPVVTDEEKAELAELAGEIWREYWPALIGEAQTEYMVANFQSLEAIERDMAEHAYEYWFVRAADELTESELAAGAEPAFRTTHAQAAATDGRPPTCSGSGAARAQASGGAPRRARERCAIAVRPRPHACDGRHPRPCSGSRAKWPKMTT